MIKAMIFGGFTGILVAIVGTTVGEIAAIAVAAALIVIFVCHD